MKALIITGALAQDHEFIYPYYRLKEEGLTVAVATKHGEQVVGSLGTKIPCDKESILMPYNLLSYQEDVALVVLPGGAKCMEYLRQEKGVLQFIHDYYNEGKIIASICHGAQLLISAKIVSGLKVSGYYSIKDDIENAGAEYVDAPCVVAGNLITCPHYKHMGEWMKQVIEALHASPDYKSRPAL